MNHINAFQHTYAAGESARDVLTNAVYKIDACDDAAIWISRVPAQQLFARAQVLDAMSAGERVKKPLFGIPFAVKDNIDVAGMPTTAGCPAYAYVPERSATAVQLLENAGAVLVGKTNLDQFATGLVGTRSPYGVPRNPYHSEYIPGGSSSGSATAVARGLVAFALGTDTAGSGRVPAGFTGTIGLKPTKGLVSTAGVVPACRSLDCVSIFAPGIDDAASVLRILDAFDARDPYSRIDRTPKVSDATKPVRLGMPEAGQREFCGDTEARESFQETIDSFIANGVAIVEIDISDCFEAARLLYEGPYVAERTAALGEFIGAHRDDVLDVTRTIIESGARYSAAELFRAQHTLQALSRTAATAFDEIDVLVVPTTPTIYRLDEIAAEPYRLNANLGIYTNFVNLLDLCAIAIPSGWYVTGPPIGITLIARACSEKLLIDTAKTFARFMNVQRR
jgi:allophanate hydrolase